MKIRGKYGIIALFFFFVVFFLTGCGGNNEEKQAQEGENKQTSLSGGTVFYGKGFSFVVPSKREILSLDSGELPKPKHGEIVLSARSKDFRYGFAPNVLVLYQKLEKPISSMDFSILNHVGSTREFLEYTKLDEKKVSFPDKDSSVLYVFEAKYNAQTPKIKYLQMGKVCYITEAYLITLALPLDVRDVSLYEELLKTFQCKGE